MVLLCLTLAVWCALGISKFMFYFYLVWSLIAINWQFFLFCVCVSPPWTLLFSLLYFHFVLNLFPCCKFLFIHLLLGYPSSVWSTLCSCSVGIISTCWGLRRGSSDQALRPGTPWVLSSHDVISGQRSCTGSQQKVSSFSTTDPLPALPTTPS